MIINGLGGLATGITLVVVLVAKFAEGAWITAILVPALIVTMLAVKQHYDRVHHDVAIDRPIRVDNLMERSEPTQDLELTECNCHFWLVVGLYVQ